MDDELPFGDGWGIDFDRMYDDYKREEYQRLNGGLACRVMRRVAFSRWRNVLLWFAFKPFISEHWQDRIVDALYPDDAVVTFPVAEARQ
jgi:hypothetical protein